MGVYINMEMPKDKAVAVVIHPDGTAYTAEMSAGVCTEYLADCTAISVPPHGRLIDADAVVAEIQDAIDNMEYSYPYLLREEQSQREHGMVFAEDIVRDAPTIIPAEEVYGQYTDTAGNFHWCGTHSGEHTIKAEEGE